MTPVENDSLFDFDLSPNQTRLGHGEVVAPSLVVSSDAEFLFPFPFWAAW